MTLQNIHNTSNSDTVTKIILPWQQSIIRINHAKNTFSCIYSLIVYTFLHMANMKGLSYKINHANYLHCIFLICMIYMHVLAHFFPHLALNIKICKITKYSITISIYKPHFLLLIAVKGQTNQPIHL